MESQETPHNIHPANSKIKYNGKSKNKMYQFNMQKEMVTLQKDFKDATKKPLEASSIVSGVSGSMVETCSKGTSSLYGPVSTEQKSEIYDQTQQLSYQDTRIEIKNVTKQSDEAKFSKIVRFLDEIDDDYRLTIYKI